MCLGDNRCCPVHSELFPSPQGSPFTVFRRSRTKGHSAGPAIQNNELGSKNIEATWKEETACLKKIMPSHLLKRLSRWSCCYPGHSNTLGEISGSPEYIQILNTCVSEPKASINTPPMDWYYFCWLPGAKLKCARMPWNKEE